MTAWKMANRYPRRGERIAPRTLRKFLLDPLPVELAGARALDGLRLCDLDESAWKQFPEDVLRKLSRVVVDKIAGRMTGRMGQRLFSRPFPRPPAGVRLEDLCIENRTRRCLAQEGFGEDLQMLGGHTIGDIQSMRSFGARCLIDLLSALESPRTKRKSRGMTSGRLSKLLSSKAQRLAALPEAAMVRADDPRFSALMRAADAEARTAADLAERLLARSQDPPEAALVARRVRQLSDRIEAKSRLTLEQELIEVFACTPKQRNRDILIGYCGWKDGRRHTLTDVGQRFKITRERVRQVCAKLTRKPKNPSTILAPVMDRALAMIATRLPCHARQIEAELAEQKFTAVGMSVEVVLDGAELLGRPVPCKVVKVDPKREKGRGRPVKTVFPDESAAGRPSASGSAKSSSDTFSRRDSRVLIRPEQLDTVPVVVDLAKKEAYFHGLATVEMIEQAIAFNPRGMPLVRQTLMLIDGFRWLDEPSGWFRLLQICKHGLPKALDKVLAVASEVTLAELRVALSRNRRLWKEPPPDNVLLEFCRQMPEVRVEGNRIMSDPPRDWREVLTGVEAKLVHMLKEHGPVMERGMMEDLCVSGGMNRFSFHAFLSWSPVIAQYGPSVYGLVGADVSQEQIDRLIADYRAGRPNHRVLHNYGWTDDGKVWLSYRLSKAASTYAVITVPAALKDVVHGCFQLLASDGRVIGVLTAKEGRAWGLGALLREQNARTGDRIVLTLDLKKQTATMLWKADGAEPAQPIPNP
jgi:hypothetical protein